MLAPAHITELEAGEELLSEHTDLDAYGDKGYISRAVKQELQERNRIGLHTISKRNQTHIPQLKIDDFTYSFDAQKPLYLGPHRGNASNQGQLRDCGDAKALAASLRPPRPSHYC